MSDTNEAQKPAKKVKDGTPASILLRESKIERDDTGKVVAIEGKCTMVNDGVQCETVRRIKPQDAFQVKFCTACQKKNNHRKIAAKRKDRRAAAKKAKTDAAPQA